MFVNNQTIKKNEINYHPLKYTHNQSLSKVATGVLGSGDSEIINDHRFDKLIMVMSVFEQTNLGHDLNCV